MYDGEERKKLSLSFTRRTLPIVLHWLKSKLFPEKTGGVISAGFDNRPDNASADERIPAVLTALFTRELNADGSLVRLPG